MNKHKISLKIILLFICACTSACNRNVSVSTTLLPSIGKTTTSRPITTPTTTQLVTTGTSTSSGKQWRVGCEATSSCDDNDEDVTGPVDTYQHIVVSGLPFHRGESYGHQVKDKIVAILDYYKTSSYLPPWANCIKFVQDHYIQALKHYYPNGLEEMRGIAKGANVTLEDILILNSRYELSRWKQTIYNQTKTYKGKASHEKPECSIYYPHTLESPIGDKMEECTGAVALSSATKYAHVLLGQNWDSHQNIVKNDWAILLEVHPHPCENIKPFVMLAEAGQLGRIGMNTDGLGIIGMSLKSTADKFIRSDEESIGWIPVTLFKRMFLEAPSFSKGLRTILTIPRHVSINMVVATGEDEALNIELTPSDHFISQVSQEKEIFAHSNHFKSILYLAQNTISDLNQGTSTIYRDRRVEKHLTKTWPRITENTFKSAFRDHVGYPSSVCEHPSPHGGTVASIILNLSQKTLLLCKGPPCNGTYKVYKFKFSQL